MNNSSAIGYDQPLFIQPFDHRGSFTKSYFGFRGAPEISPAGDGFAPVAAAKSLIYRGLLRAIEGGVPKEQVGILVDAQFGGQILADAAARGIPRAVCIEKSGQAVFDFEYGVRWVTHIRYHRPDIVKVLVRLHPDDPAADTAAQLTRLQLVSDYLHGHERRLFMFELLVPATTEADREAGDAYDRDIRPGHMVRAIHLIQDFGIEPDIWKIEGVDRAEDAERVAAAVRSGKGREHVGSIVLGRGSDGGGGPQREGTGTRRLHRAGTRFRCRPGPRMAPGGGAGGRLHRFRRRPDQLPGASRGVPGRPARRSGRDRADRRQLPVLRGHLAHRPGLIGSRLWNVILRRSSPHQVVP